MAANLDCTQGPLGCNLDYHDHLHMLGCKTLRMDKNLKPEIHRSLSNPGPDLSEYSALPAGQDVRDKELPFGAAMEIPNAETRQALQDTLEGKGLSRRYSSFDEMMKDIDADD